MFRSPRTKYGINRNCLYIPPSKSLDQLDLLIVCKHKLTITSKKSPDSHLQVKKKEKKKDEFEQKTDATEIRNSVYLFTGIIFYSV